MQMLIYYWYTKDKIDVFIRKHRPKGIDRAVQLGKSMDFSLVWDGYDLIYELSREVTL